MPTTTPTTTTTPAPAPLKVAPAPASKTAPSAKLSLSMRPGEKQIEASKGRNGFEYIINSMLIFAIIGMCIKMFFGNETSKDGTYGRANSTIWGYGIVSFSILIVMFVSFAIHDRIAKIEKKSGGGIIAFIKSFFSSAGPAILTVVILFWIITLNSFNYISINKGTVAKEYYQLSAGTSFLFLFQILCLFQYLKLFIDAKIQEKGKTGTETSAGADLTRITFASYFIAAINIVVVCMMTIILEFFSTDG